jgi:hypothetical protein
MGNSQSSIVETNISNEVNVAISNVVNTTVNNEGSCDIDTDGSKDAVFGACSELTCPGGFNFTQSSKTMLSCLQANQTDVTIEMTNDVTTAITNTITAIMEQVQKGVGNVGDKQHTENITKISNEINVKIENEITNAIRNVFDTLISVDSDDNIVFNGKLNSDAECNFTQQTVTEIISSQISETVINVLIGNTTITNILNQYDLTVKQTQEGFDLNKFFSDLFSGIQNMWNGIMKNLPGGAISDWLTKLVPIAIVIAIGVAVVVIGGIVAKSFASKGNSNQEMVDGGYMQDGSLPPYDEF